MRRRYLIAGLQSEVMLQIHVNLRPEESPLFDVLAPERDLCVEGLPVSLVERIERQLFQFSLMEQEVFDKIRWQERCPPSIQGFEADLRIILLTEVDNDEP